MYRLCRSIFAYECDMTRPPADGMQFDGPAAAGECCATVELSLASLLVAKSRPALIGWGKGVNVTSAGWQVTLCDTIWHG